MAVRKTYTSKRILLAALMLMACDASSITRVEQGDVYIQGGGPVSVDILWVIDSSGTMSEEQAALRSSLPAFVAELLESDVDFHLGVITMDMEDDAQSGQLVGDPPYLVRSSPDLESSFYARANVGISGSRDERAFDALKRALSPSLSSTGANSGFLRSGAELALILISDEDDQSDLSVGGLESFLLELKAQSAVRASAIVGDVPAGCASLYAAADPAPRYLELAEDLEGLAQSICGAPYDEVLRRIVRNLSHIQDTFALSAIPDGASLQVRVDEVILQERQQDGWTYLPDQNAIRIQGTPLPLPGQKVEIRYDRLHF